MKKYCIIAAAALAFAACAPKTTETEKCTFPEINQDGKIAIVAHRGFWNCEASGFAENTIASLREAQNNGLWGSEFDVQLTKDDVAIVNHNRDIQGMVIAEHTYDELVQLTLANGEHPSTIDEYLAQGEKCATTMLVCELKAQATPEKEDMLMKKTIDAVKAHGLYDPSRIIFITFSHYMCDALAKSAPEFINQFLNGDFCPSELQAEGVNGIDYNEGVLRKHPFWVEEAHNNGMSVNVWTVNKEESMKEFAAMNVDAITTNEPLLAREILGEREFKLAK